jgi:hypothetical protein
VGNLFLVVVGGVGEAEDRVVVFLGGPGVALGATAAAVAGGVVGGCGEQTALVVVGGVVVEGTGGVRISTSDS